MSDTKLDPASLTAEERAIVDREAWRNWFGADGLVADEAFKRAFELVRAFILARRALFAPAKEEAKVCPNCGEITPYDHRSNFDPQAWSCEPPENCNPFPLTPPSEMPEAVHPVARAVDALITASEYYEDDESIAVCVQAAEDLEFWWRSQPAPAVAMTEELERVIDAASARALWHLDNTQRGTFNAICDDVAAVRQQASQPKTIDQRIREAVVDKDKEIEELKAKLAEFTAQRDAWLEHLRRSHEGLMILHDRPDLQEMAGLRCGDFMADAVPFMIAELDRQNILIARMEVKFATCPWIAMAFCAHAASRNGYPLEAEQVSEWLKTTATI